MSPLRIGRRIVAVAPLAIALLAGACAPAPGAASAPAPTTTVAPNTPGQVFVTYQLDDPNASTQPLQLQVANGEPPYADFAALAPVQTSAAITTPAGNFLNISHDASHITSRWTCRSASGRSETNVDYPSPSNSVAGIGLNLIAGETVRCTVYAHPIMGTLSITSSKGAPTVRDVTTGTSIAADQASTAAGSSRWFALDVVRKDILAAKQVFRDSAGIPLATVAISSPGATWISCTATSRITGASTGSLDAQLAPNQWLFVGRDDDMACTLD
ncbi:MAG: hypothetical protein ACOYNI_12515 [Acidimicrobiia bacterium]